jgi:serine/threonine protein kinase
MIYRLLQGLANIHQKNIAHQDIKPENILYLNQSREAIPDFLYDALFNKRSLQLKYSDLGTACSLSDVLQLCHNNNTLHYIAPEFTEVPESYADEERLRRPAFEFAEKGDLWALGLTFWFLLFHDHPLFEYDDDDQKTFRVLRSFQGKSYEDVFPKMYQSSNQQESLVINVVLKSLLEPDPEKRVRAEALVNFMKEQLPEMFL